MLDGPRAGRVFVLDRRDTLIGAGFDSTIRIREEGICVRHALIHAVDGRQPVIVDLTGDGRTRLNGEVVGDAPLLDGDILILGPQVVARFEYRDVVRSADCGPAIGMRVAPPLFRALPRDQRAIASLYAHGHTEPEIADALDLDVEAVTRAVTALRRRFDVRGRGPLIARLVGAS